MKKKAFKAAFPYTLPICVGFLFLGMSYGFMMRSKGFSFVYPLCMSFFIYAGSMEFVTANLLLSAFTGVCVLSDTDGKCKTSVLRNFHAGEI